MKIYVGCSLTYASEEYRNDIKTFKNKLRNYYEILDFFSPIKNGKLNNDWIKSKDVFEWDSNCIKECDILIAECSYPSLWLWYEIWYANNLWKKIIALAKDWVKVSKMIKWINTPNFSFFRYENNILDTIKLIDNKIKK